MNIVLNTSLKRVSKELGVDVETVEKIYRSYWLFIRESIKEYSIKWMPVEDTDTISANFNIPFLGKLYVDRDKIKKYHKRLKHYKYVEHKED